MLQPRSIENLQKYFFQSLLNQNTTLTDISQGSNLYALGRAIASQHNQQDLILQQFAESIFINSAVDSDLDLRAADYAVTRKSGEYSVGFVLVISNTENFSLNPTAILTDPFTTLQFEVIGDQSYSISPFAEVKVPVRSTTVGVEGNLKGSTRLISPTFPQGNFTVGSHRTSAGEYCGDLSGGRDRESDELFRQRVIKSIVHSRSTTDDAIKASLLDQPNVLWVAINVPNPGIIQVWVDSDTSLPSSELLRLEQIAKSVKPAGTILTIQQTQRVLTNINIRIRAKPEFDIRDLTNALISTVKTYFLNLGLGSAFIRSDLLKRVSLLAGVVESSFIDPTEDVFPTSYKVVRLDKVSITYETGG